MSLKGLINKGYRKIDDDARMFIYQQRVYGTRKSAVKSMLLEFGYSKEDINKHLDHIWEEAKGFKDTEDGRDAVVFYKKEKLKNGLIFLFITIILWIVEYVLDYYFHFGKPTIFYIFILPTLYYFFRGVSGL